MCAARVAASAAILAVRAACCAMSLPLISPPRAATQFATAGKSEAQPPAGSPPQAPRAQGVRRPGPARGSERCGRLAATPGDAPVASTPPRRREPGR